MELLLGCGRDRGRRIQIDGRDGWRELVTLDNNPDHEPDVLWDLTSQEPLPFPDDTFDELHAYEVLEHIGQQGDFRTFFRQFSEFWRILKPGGVLAATCPSYRSQWAWGDPSHTRVIQACTLTFLSQEQYHKGIGSTAMSDFRYLYQADFEPAQDGTGRRAVMENSEELQFVLVAIKPARGFDADAEGRGEEHAEEDGDSADSEAGDGRRGDAAGPEHPGDQPRPAVSPDRGRHRQAPEIA
jgi:SAM-dependent methyltransferase